MGYVSGEDFDWSASWALTDRLGITHGEYNAKTNKAFQRGDAALVSAWRAEGRMQKRQNAL